mgnify:CR=1 FL=1|jgi:hypothetical protein
MPITLNGSGTIAGISTGGISNTKAVADAAMPAGSILQVKQTVKLDTFSTTSTSDVDITGFSVAITLGSSSNNVLVTVSICLSSQSMFVYGILRRGNTQIGEADGASNRIRPTLMSYNTNEGTAEHHTFTFLDSPGAGTHTYKMQIRCATSGHAVVNKSYRDTDTVDYDSRHSSTITVMEVAA